MLNPLDMIGKGVPPWLRRILAERLLAPRLTEQLVYWRAERLDWEGVTHPDGGDHDEQAEIHAVEGAETAIRRLADHFGVETLPGEDLTHTSGLTRLFARLESNERAALKTLDRLGPSRRIPLGEHLHEYMEASDAEAALERVDRILEYAEWMYQAESTERANCADRGNRANCASNDEGART
jgi:hypothetical protein